PEGRREALRRAPGGAEGVHLLAAAGAVRERGGLHRGPLRSRRLDRGREGLPALQRQQGADEPRLRGPVPAGRHPGEPGDPRLALPERRREPRLLLRFGLELRDGQGRRDRGRRLGLLSSRRGELPCERTGRAITPGPSCIPGVRTAAKNPPGGFPSPVRTAWSTP